MFLRSFWFMLMAVVFVTEAPHVPVARAEQIGSPGVSPATIQPFVPGPEFVNTADPVLPGAEEVVGDVQNVMFWSRFQRGVSNGWYYVVFPDGSATIMEDSGQREAAYTLACTSGVSCLVRRADGTSFAVPATGSGRPDSAAISDGETLSRYLAEWILSGTGAQPSAPAVVDGPTNDKKQSDTLTSADSDTGLPVGTRAPSDGGEVTSAPASADPGARDAAADPLEQVNGGSGSVPGNANSRPSDRAGAADPQEDVCSELAAFMPSGCATSFANTAPRRTTPKPVTTKPSTNPNAPAVEDGAEEPSTDDDRETFVERTNLRCSVTGSFSLRHTDSDTQDTGPGKPRVGLGCSGNITEKLTLRFFLQEYLNPEDQQPWDPDFTYALTYKVSERINLTYSNYLARFDGPDGGFFDALASGKLRGSFKLPKFELPNGKTVACSTGIGLPKLVESSVSLSCGASITKKLRVSGTAYAYFPGEQGTYEPDYSYTASYRISDQFTVSYSNYSNNRWPWNQNEASGPGLLGGSFSVTYRFKF